MCGILGNGWRLRGRRGLVFEEFVPPELCVLYVLDLPSPPIATTLALIPQAFVAPSIGQPALASTTSLDASRTNAKQEKRKRNRENMRKFKKGGRRGTSKKKMMRKMQSSAARQVCK